MGSAAARPAGGPPGHPATDHQLGKGIGALIRGNGGRDFQASVVLNQVQDLLGTDTSLQGPIWDLMGRPGFRALFVGEPQGVQRSRRDALLAELSHTYNAAILTRLVLLIDGCLGLPLESPPSPGVAAGGSPQDPLEVGSTQGSALSMDRSESQLSVSLERDPPMNPFAELSEAALLMGPGAPLPPAGADHLSGPSRSEPGVEVSNRRGGLGSFAGLGLAALTCFGMGWLGYQMVRSIGQPASGPNASDALEASAPPPAEANRQELTRQLLERQAQVQSRVQQGVLSDRITPEQTVSLACLAGGQPEVAAAADPSNFGRREARDWQGRPVANSPALIVLHETVVDEQGTLALFQRPNANDAQQASYHVLIGRDGRRLRVVDDDQRAYGAGDSRYRGLEVQLRPGVPPSVNNIALHVSLVSPPDGADGEGEGHSGYTAAQYRSLARQIALWQSQYGIGSDRVVTHQEVDNSGTRRDPRSLDWSLLGREHRSQVLACSSTAPMAGPPPQSAPAPKAR